MIRSSEIRSSDYETFDQLKNDNFDQVNFGQVIPCLIDAQSFSNSFEEVHGVVKKFGRGSSIFVFYCIFMLLFFKVF